MHMCAVLKVVFLLFDILYVKFQSIEIITLLIIANIALTNNVAPSLEGNGPCITRSRYF